MLLKTAKLWKHLRIPGAPAEGFDASGVSRSTSFRSSSWYALPLCGRPTCASTRLTYSRAISSVDVRLEVKRRNDREDCRSGLGGQRHVAKMNAVEWCLADAENQRPALLQADVGSALDQADSPCRWRSAPASPYCTAGRSWRRSRKNRWRRWRRCRHCSAAGSWPAARPSSLLTTSLRPEMPSSSAITRKPLSETTRLTVTDALVPLQGIQQVLGNDGPASAGDGHRDVPGCHVRQSSSKVLYTAALSPRESS